MNVYDLPASTAVCGETSPTFLAVTKQAGTDKNVYATLAVLQGRV
jgi:hypothetical protein